MPLVQYYNKKVKITDKDGCNFSGMVNDYIYPEDNEPEQESIIIDTNEGEVLEFYEKDIRQICVIGARQDLILPE